jgi:2-desacetyl-2-hydroxyethyl bacteriochlorophyllide A dehydrogenase
VKALKIAEAGRLEVVQVDKPVQDGEHVIIEVSYVGLCGSDLGMWAGGGRFAGNIIGHEYAGKVIDPGPRDDLKVGDLVTGIPQNYCRDCYYCNKGDTHLCPETPRRGGPGVSRQGANSPYFAIRADLAMKLSDKLDPKVAALVEPVSSGYHGAKLGHIQQGDKVLIIGGGIIAIMTAWWVKQMGAQTIVMSEINPVRIEHLKKHSVATQVVNLQEEGVFEQVQKQAGLGFDVVFECSHPTEELFNKTMVPLVRKGGTIVQVGAMVGPFTFDFYPFLTKEIRYQSCWSYSEEDFRAAIKAVEENEADFAKHITNVISLEQAQDTFVALATGKSKDIKVLIDPKL